MIVSRAKQRLAQLCRLSPFLDPAGLSVMYKSFIRSCLEYMAIFFISVLPIVIWSILMLFSIELLEFVMTLFLLWNQADTLQRSGSHVGSWMVMVVVIYSHFVLALFQISLYRRSSHLMICQILPEHVDYTILLHSDLWTVFAEVGTL